MMRETEKEAPRLNRCSKRVYLEQVLRHERENNVDAVENHICS